MPEERIVDHETQISTLHTRLAGHGAFGRVRGKLGAPIAGMLPQMGDRSRDFCRAWDELAPDIRIMGSMHAQLIHDGMPDAAEHLRRALAHSQYLIPGETVPLEQTRPVTLVAPRGVLPRLTWARGDGEGYNFFCGDGDLGPLVDRLRFPDGLALVCGSYDLMMVRRYKDKDPNYSHMAFLLLGDQRETLERFTREEQELIATWQFNVPTTWIPSTDSPVVMLSQLTFFVGLHKEDQHERWQKESPLQASRGVQDGFGAFIVVRHSRTTAYTYWPNMHLLTSADYVASLDLTS